ncbi:MFS transporter [Varibaculum cambriense]|uniref:MFS transporter n=1 Tax=Varibaculum cambriense TaxID=184870 RepID=UPI000C7AB4B4|nr:MFS transporter [Varibaculum cambriense]WIK88794.1 MFS transporter [Varibaculum cambriense]
MFKSYREIFAYPGALSFSIAGAIARFPMAMAGLSTLLMISILYGEYSLAGQVNAVVVITMAAASPIQAQLVDRHGQAKILRPLVAASLVLLAALAVAAIYQAPRWTLYVIAALSGATTGSFGAFVRARWTHLLAGSRKLNTAYAFEAALDEVIFIFGPIIATVLATVVHPAAGIVACLLTSGIGGFWFLSQRETEPIPRGKADFSPEEAKPLLKSTAMVVLGIIFMLCGLTFGALDLTVVAYCREVGLAEIAGILLALFGVTSFSAAVIYGAKEWGVSALRLFVGGIILMAIGFSTLFFASNVWILGLCLALTGATYAPTMTNATNILASLVPPSRFTEGMAWLNTFFTLGISAGAWIGGNVVDAGGARAGLWVVIAAAWAILAVVLAGSLPLRNSLRRAYKRRLVAVDLHLAKPDSQPDSSSKNN